MGLTKLDCMPLLWVFQSRDYQTWSIPFGQHIACKFLVFKLIDSHKAQSVAENEQNIDMFAL